MPGFPGGAGPGARAARVQECTDGSLSPGSGKPVQEAPTWGLDITIVVELLPEEAEETQEKKL